MKNFDHNEIEKSLDGMSRAKCPDDMAKKAYEAYLRVPANIWDRAVLVLSRPMVAAACIAMIIILNIALLLNAEPGSGQSNNSDMIIANATLFDQNDSYTKP